MSISKASYNINRRFNIEKKSRYNGMNMMKVVEMIKKISKCSEIKEEIKLK